MSRGFTIVELVISVAIFVAMTTLIVAKYGTFNSSTLLTDAAYDTALVLRLAQTYGLSVKNASTAGTATNFNLPYGIDFNTGSGYCGGATSDTRTFVLFADSNPATPDGLCGLSDTSITPYTLLQGSTITSLCAGSDHDNCRTPDQSMTRLSVSFMRPNPEAIICGIKSGSTVCTYRYAEVMLTHPSGGYRTLVIRQNGQISISNTNDGPLTCSANYGQSCESPSNSCGQVNYAAIMCDGSCPAVMPDEGGCGGGWYYGGGGCVQNEGDSCESTPNNCGWTNWGTVQCDGSCDAVQPADDYWSQGCW